MVSSRLSSKLSLGLLLLVWVALISYCNFDRGGPRQLPSYPLSPQSVTTPSTRRTTFEGLTIWSSDFHISPIADLKHLLAPYNVKFIDKSLSSHCHLTQTCQHDLRVIDQNNGIDLGPCPNQLRRQFYESYRTDPELLSSDIILCTHAASMCELFMPFNKTLVVIASTRYEIGRHDRIRWGLWNDNLRRISRVRGNVVAANNVYDQQYMKYFTGIGNIKLMPSYCGYIVDRYDRNSQGSGKDVLIGPSRGVSPILLNQLEKAQVRHLRKHNSNRRNVRLTPIRTVYPVHHEYSEIAAHPAIVFLPYQVSLMSFFEFYRMNIPLYVPSAQLLSLWHAKYAVLSERTWDRVFGRPGPRSAIGPAERSSCSLFSHDPNNEFNLTSITEWVKLSDYYQWPHIRLFDSWSQLLDMLESDDFGSISEGMQSFNAQSERYIRNEWLSILNTVTDIKEEREMTGNTDIQLANDINESLEKYFNIKLSSESCL